MTRKELVDRLSEQCGGALSRPRIVALVDDVFEHVADALVAEGRFNHAGFGTFTVRVRNARTGLNPRTGEPLALPESKTVHFRPSQKLKERLNGPE